MGSKWVWRGGIALLSWGLVQSLVMRSSLPGAQETRARLTLSVGQVTVKGPGLAPEASAVLNQTFNEGDMIRTGEKSRAEITLPEERGVVRVAEGSLLAMIRLGGRDSTRKTEAHLDVGRAWINLRALGHIKQLEEQRRDFYLSSPMAVSGVRGTVYRMDVAPDSTSRVLVYEGQVQVGWAPQQAFIPGKTILQAPTEVAGPQEITMAAWVELIRAGQQAVLTPDRKVAVSQIDTTRDAQDAWVQWNRARDEGE